MGEANVSSWQASFRAALHQLASERYVAASVETNAPSHSELSISVVWRSPENENFALNAIVSSESPPWEAARRVAERYRPEELAHLRDCERCGE